MVVPNRLKVFFSYLIRIIRRSNSNVIKENDKNPNRYRLTKTYNFDLKPILESFSRSDQYIAFESIEELEAIDVYPFHHPDIYQSIPEMELQKLVYTASAVPSVWMAKFPLITETIYLSSRLLINYACGISLTIELNNEELPIIEVFPFHDPNYYQVTPEKELLCLTFFPIKSIGLFHPQYSLSVDEVHLSQRQIIRYANKIPFTISQNFSEEIIEVYPFHTPNHYQVKPDGELTKIGYIASCPPVIRKNSNLPVPLETQLSQHLIILYALGKPVLYNKDNNENLTVIDVEPYHNPNVYSEFQEKELLLLTCRRGTLPVIYKNFYSPVANTTELSPRLIIRYACKETAVIQKAEEPLLVIDVFPFHKPNLFSATPEKELKMLKYQPKDNRVKFSVIEASDYLKAKNVLSSLIKNILYSPLSQDHQLRKLSSPLLSDKEKNDDQLFRLPTCRPRAAEQVEHKKLISQSNRNSIAQLVRKYESLSQEDFLDTFNSMELSFDEIISILGERLSEGKLIGYNLLQVFEDETLYSRIMSASEVEMRKLVLFVTPAINENLILISMILVAMESYDGQFWEHMRNAFSKVYYKTNVQTVESKLRNIITEFGIKNVRQINFLIQNAIVPQPFLGAFADFMFDIYESFFHYQLPKELEVELFHIFHKSENLSSLSFRKEYRLIASIKQTLNSNKGKREFTKFSAVLLRYIDRMYWKLNTEDLPYHYYFEKPIKNWYQINFKDEFHKTRSKTAVSIQKNPIFFLGNKKVWLEIPSLRLEIEKITGKIIFRIKNGDKLIAENLPKVRKRDGYFESQAFTVALDKPLGFLQLEVVMNGVSIYSTGRKLFRSEIIFTPDGNEIGQAPLGCPCIIATERLNHFYPTDCISMQNGWFLVETENGNSLESQDIEAFNMVDLNPVINGESVKNAWISFINHEYPIYRRISSIRLKAFNNAEDIIIRINGKPILASNLDPSYSREENHLYLNLIASDYLHSGLNKLQIINRLSGKASKTELLFYDPSFYAKDWINEKKLAIRIRSVFVNVDSFADLSKNNPYRFEFEEEGIDQLFQLTLFGTVPLYRINQNRWRTCDQTILKDEFSGYDQLQFMNIRSSYIEVRNKGGEVLHHYDFIKRQIFPLAFLDNLKATETSGFHVVLKSQKRIETSIYYQLYEEVLLKSFDLDYIEEENQIFVSFDTDYTNSLIVILASGGEELESQKVEALDGETEFELHYPYALYTVCIYQEQQAEDLFSLDTNRRLVAKKTIFTDNKSLLLGQQFLVTEFSGMLGDRKSGFRKQMTVTPRSCTITIQKRFQNQSSSRYIFSGEMSIREIRVPIMLVLTKDFPHRRHTVSIFSARKEEGNNPQSQLYYDRRYGTVRPTWDDRYEYLRIDTATLEYPDISK